MSARGYLKLMLLVSLIVPVIGCGSAEVDSITISPTQVTLAAGNTVQFTAVGTYGHGSHPSTQQDITSQVKWTSALPQVATIDASGLLTTVAPGTTTVTATTTGFTGVITATATVTVPAPSGGGSGSSGGSSGGSGGSGGTTGSEPIVSLSITPSSQTALAINENAQFIAIGTTSSGTTVDLTNQSATVNGATIAPAVWSSSIPAVATINTSTGIATSLTAGTSTITAMVKNPDGSVVLGTATLTVTSGSASSEPLTSMAVDPTSQTLTQAGQAAEFIAIGSTGTGTTVNLTNQGATIGSATVNAAVWSSSVPSVATINPATGVATAVANGVTVITAVAKNPDGTVVTGTATLTVNVTSSPEPVVSLTIIPSSQTAYAINQTSQFIAIGTTGSGGTVNLTDQANWISSNVNVATVNPTSGLATAVGTGTTAITALVTNPDGTVVTGTAAFTVSSQTTTEPYVSLTITPSSQTAYGAGQTAQFIAIGTTGSGTTVDLTDQAQWLSSNTSVATVDAKTGLATAVSSGTTAISAIVTNPDGTVVTGTAAFTVTVSTTSEPLVSLSIIPSTQTVLAVGQTAQYYAIGTTSTGATVDLTTQGATVGTATIGAASWSSTNTSVATISTGLATSTGTGSTAIVAMVKNPDGSVVTGTAALTVTNQTWVSLSVLPGSQTAEAAGETAQFIAIGTTGTGTTADLTNLAKWSSSDPSIATVNSAGLATAVNSGTATITAIYTNSAGTVQGSATYSVTVTTAQEPLLSLEIIPVSQTVATLGETAQFLAIGTFSSDTAAQNLNCTPSSGLVRDCTNVVTWISSDTKVATITSTGLATGVGAGSAAITAKASNADGTVVLGAASITESATGTGVADSTLTVTLIGSGANNAGVVVTAPSPQNPTGTSVIDCTPTNPTGCVQPFPLGSTVTLTATPPAGTQFGGWSSNCVQIGTINPTGSNSCTITLSDDSTVAAIFY